MIDRDAVIENLRGRKAGFLLMTFGRTWENSWDEVFLLYKRSQGGYNALEVQDLVVRELASRGRDRLFAQIGRVRQKLTRSK